MSVPEYSQLNKPVFLLGTQRAGTTLLTRALSAHPHMFIQNEIGVQEIFRNNPSKEQIVERILKRISDIIDLDFSEYAKQNDLCAWGVKDPEFTDYIEQLEKFIPQSRFIIIVRDCRAVVNSYIDNKWGLGTTPYTGAIRWRREVLAQKAFMDKYPESFLLIRYEDMVMNFESVMKEVCEHIGLPYDEAMVTYNRKKADFEINRQNVNTNKAPDKSHIEKWRKFFNHRDIQNIESVAGDAMAMFGYKCETSGASPSPFRKSYYLLHQKIIGEIQIQYQWRRARWLEQKRVRAKQKA